MQKNNYLSKSHCCEDSSLAKKGTHRCRIKFTADRISTGLCLLDDRDCGGSTVSNSTLCGSTYIGGKGERD